MIKQNQKISEISFESYDLNLSPYQKKEDVWIYADELKTSIINFSPGSFKGREEKTLQKLIQKKHPYKTTILCSADAAI